MTAMPYAIEPQQPGDAAAIEILLDRAFGPDRLAKTSYRYRRRTSEIPGLSFVARETGGRLLGTLRFWPVLIGADPHTGSHTGTHIGTPALLLGPLAVARENDGIGGALIERGLAAARAKGHGIVLLVGEAEYYARFGFTPASSCGLFMPGEPDRLMAREILPGAMDGVRGPVLPRRGVRPGLRAA